MCLQVAPPPEIVAGAGRPKGIDQGNVGGSSSGDSTGEVPLCLKDDIAISVFPLKRRKHVQFAKVTVTPEVATESKAAKDEASKTAEPSVKESKPEPNEPKAEEREAEAPPNTSSEPVRRPMNSFMVFARQHRAAMQKAHPHKDNKAISRILGDTWSNMSPFERQRYVDMASDLAQQHKKDHPNYKFRRVLKRKHKANKPGSVHLALQPQVSVRPHDIVPVPSTYQARYTPYTAVYLAPVTSYNDWSWRSDHAEEMPQWGSPRDHVVRDRAPMPECTTPPLCGSGSDSSHSSQSSPVSNRAVSLGNSYSGGLSLLLDNCGYMPVEQSRYQEQSRVAMNTQPKKQGCLWSVESMLK